MEPTNKKSLFNNFYLTWSTSRVTFGIDSYFLANFPLFSAYYYVVIYESFKNKQERQHGISNTKTS